MRRGPAAAHITSADRPVDQRLRCGVGVHCVEERFFNTELFV